MNKLFYIVGFVVLALIAGCANNENASFEMASDDYSFVESKETSEVESSADEEVAEDIEVERKLIKEGNVDFETENISLTRKTVFESVEKYKGYISSDLEYKSTGRISNTIIIRVPAKNFDLLLEDATKGITKFDNKNIEVKDVTEEFLDIEARLKTKKELERRYLEILTKANTVSEILEVERQIGDLRSEIESIEGRLKYLVNKVSLSTLTISFYESVEGETEFGNQFKDGFKNGWQNLIWFFVGLTNVWPFVIFIFGLVFWLVKRKKQ